MPTAVDDRLDSERLDWTFSALADPTRRAILARLAQGEATVNELAAPFDLTPRPSRSTSRCWSEAAWFRAPGAPSSGRAASNPRRSTRPSRGSSSPA